MRISSDKKDPGYPLLQEMGAQGYKIIIRLDGRVVREVVTADDGAGLIVVYETSPSGELVLNPAGDRVLEKTLRGYVEIIRCWPPLDL